MVTSPPSPPLLTPSTATTILLPVAPTAEATYQALVRRVIDIVQTIPHGAPDEGLEPIAGHGRTCICHNAQPKDERRPQAAERVSARGAGIRDGIDFRLHGKRFLAMHSAACRARRRKALIRRPE